MAKKTGPKDPRWIRRCIELASRGQGKVSPNPMVGSVVLDRRGRLVGEGFHRGPGRDHAEVVALKMAGSKAVGGTLYVNLEPCNHHGRTGPCSTSIANAKVARVVYGASDPIRGHRGGGRALRKLGIGVDAGILRADCETHNRIFFTAARLGRPHVVVKAGGSLDGKTQTSTGESKWITSTQARAHGRRLRGHLDAIAVGIGTVLADDPQLTARRRGSRDPLRVIFDSRLRTPVDAKLLPANSDSKAQCVIVTHVGAHSGRAQALAAAGAEILEVGELGGVVNESRLDVLAVLRILAARDVSSILIEGGSTLIGSFVDCDLVDEIRLYMAPMIIGGQSPGWVGGHGLGRLSDAARFTVLAHDTLGPDLAITALRKR